MIVQEDTLRRQLSNSLQTIEVRLAAISDVAGDATLQTEKVYRPRASPERKGKLLAQSLTAMPPA